MITHERNKQFEAIKEMALIALDLCGGHDEIKDYCKENDIDYSSPFCQSAIFQAHKDFRS